MITLPAIPLTPGTSQSVQIPISQLGGPVGSFKVANESPYPLTIGWAGNSQTLAPWTADVFPAQGVQTFTIGIGGNGSSAGAEALVDVAAQGEPIPGQYPLSLPGQTTLNGGSIDVGSITGPVTVENATGVPLSVIQTGELGGEVLQLAPGTTAGSIAIPIPAGAQSIALIIGDRVNTDVVTNVLVTVENLQYTVIAEIINEAGPFSNGAVLYGTIEDIGTNSLGQASHQIAIQGTTPASNGGQITIVPFFFPTGVVNVAEIVNTPNNPVQVTIGQYSPLSAPTQSEDINVTSSTGPGQIVHLVTAASGKTVYLFGMSFSDSAASSGTILRSSVTDKVLWRHGFSTSYTINWPGLAAPAGEGVDLVTGAGGGTQYFGTLWYSQE